MSDERGEKVQAILEGKRELLCEVSCFLHANPELSFREYKAVELLTGILRREGFAVTEKVADLETAFVAAYPAHRPTPTVAFLAEYDALPEIGHACGHNLIAASALGAALAVKSLLPKAGGSVLLVGCPAEEKGGGKIPLLKAGLFNGVAAALLVHPDNRTQVDNRSLALRKLTVEFFGKASHASAAPEKGINALNALILSFTNLAALSPHLPRSSRIHGIITEGGQAPNIIPAYAAGLFALRAADMPTLEETCRRAEECFQAAAAVTGARAQIRREGEDYEPLKGNPVLAERFRQHLTSCGVSCDPPQEGMGSTDVGNLSTVLSVLHPSLAIAPPDVACHSPEFAAAAASPEGERMIQIAATTMACTALDLLTDPPLRKAVEREFAAGRSA